MDGWEFLARVKKLPALRHVPVVIISIQADFTKGVALGAAAVMQKPVTRKDLYGSLAQLGLFAPAEGQSVTVLVVDDDPKAVELVAVRLAAIGASVLRANGGQQAIDLARAQLPDLIVLDLAMPAVSGFEVVEALRAEPETARIPIIVMTAKRTDAGDRERLDGAVTTIMEKGQFDRGRFISEVRRAMSGRLPER
jgi:CheY-like chemotaxis protein